MRERGKARGPPLDTKAGHTSAGIDRISPVTTLHGLRASHNRSLISIKMIDRTIKIRGMRCIIQYCLIIWLVSDSAEKYQREKRAIEVWVFFVK